MAQTQALPKLTLRQDRLVDVLASGKASTQRQAAAMAGLHETSVSVALRNPNVVTALELRKQKKLDRARGIAALADRVFAKGEHYLEQLSPREQLAFALEAKKLAASLPEERADKHAQVEAFDKHCQRIWEVARRWERRLWLRNSAELTPALQERLPDITIESSEVLCNQSDSELTYSPLSDHTSEGL